MKNDSKKIEVQLEEIFERLDAIEKGRATPRDPGEKSAPENGMSESCGLPIVPERKLETGIDTLREGLIRSIEKKWVNGTELKYHFFKDGAWGGRSDQRKIVRDAFDEWKGVGIGLDFAETDSIVESDIRIGFLLGDGSWSYVGRDTWSRPNSDRTMNFGWRLHGQDGRDTALHEIGHTLGFHHEQQNPFAGIEWDEDAVYSYFMGPPNNWSRQKTYHNVLRALDPNSVEGSEWDPDSIMQYGIRAGLILRPEEFKDGLNPDPGLSEIDKTRVRLFYPEIGDELDELKRFEAARLDLAPAEQVNFSIKPQSTRQRKIQTFGSSDTVMVLFEDNDGALEHFAADDDSGWSRNASLSVRLVRGRSYVLRVRLYFSEAQGETAVMMW